MITKEELAKEIGVSRKTLYNYLDELKIKKIDDASISKIKDYAIQKNKSKEISKTDLLEELEKLKSENTKLKKENEFFEESQKTLLNQIEWYKNNIDIEIRQIKENMTLLLNPPKSEKKSIFDKIFKRK